MGMTSKEYTYSYRVAPLWAVLLLTIPAGLAAWGVAAASYYDSLAGTPLIALILYGLAAGYLNRARVRVNEQGISADRGPLPVGVHAVWVPREEIARVYVRIAWMPGKPSPLPYLAAGVQRADGRWLDLTEPLAGPEEVRQRALEMSVAMDWTEMVEEVQDLPAGLDEKPEAPTRLWGGLAAAGALWAFYASRL